MVTWFAALFYQVRLFIYSTEASQNPPGQGREAVINQLAVMQRRLWCGIGWPSAIATLLFGGILLCYHLFVFSGPLAAWLWVKLVLVMVVFLYHLACHRIYKEQSEGVFRYSSIQLRLWNEVATLLLFGIVFAAILREQISILYMSIFLLSFGFLMWRTIIRLAKRRSSNRD